MKGHWKRIHRRGFTLVEALVSVGILGIVTSTSVAAMLFSARLGQSSIEDMIAIEALNRESELIRTWPMYSELGDTAVRFLDPDQISDLITAGVDINFENIVGGGSADPGEDPSGTFGAEATVDEGGINVGIEGGGLGGGTIDVGLESGGDDASNASYDNTVYYDGEFPGNGIVYRMEYDWYGFGWTTSGSDSRGLVMRDARWAWPEDIDLTGRRIVLRGAGGRGGQIANITDWNPNNTTFTIDSKMNGWSRSDWFVTPGAGEYFEVDGGKHVRVTMRWGRDLEELENDPKVRVRDVFIPNRPDPGSGVNNI